jgi:hypothetical protein
MWIAHPFGRARRHVRCGARFRSVKLLKTAALADDLDQRDRIELRGRRTQRVVVARPMVQAARPGRLRHDQPSSATHSFCGTLVAIGITVSQYQADAQRVVVGDLWKLTGRGEDEVGLPVSSERRKRAYALPASPIASSHPRQAGHPRRRVARQSLGQRLHQAIRATRACWPLHARVVAGPLRVAWLRSSGSGSLVGVLAGCGLSCRRHRRLSGECFERAGGGTYRGGSGRPRSATTCFMTSVEVRRCTPGRAPRRSS